MVFWKTYPIYNVLQTLWNRKPFLSMRFEKDTVTSPTGTPCKIHTVNNTLPTVLKDIQQYLRSHFGKPPHKPVLNIPLHYLLGTKDCILTVRDDTIGIVGCIRYHYMGEFITSNNEPIYCVDCFCIHPDWRGKGIGDYLLTELHFYVNRYEIPYSLFLKEGSQLSIVHPPMYSGNYVYRKVRVPMYNKYIFNITVKDAYHMIDIWKELHPQLFIIRNKESTNQKWVLYKKGIYRILACIQDAFQLIDTKRIGWITAWIESASMTDCIRKEAATTIADYSGFEFIWMNRVWENCDTHNNEWKEDGTFYWYSYQWATGISIGSSYCILS